MRTSLSGKLPVTPWDETDLRKKAAKLWHATGTVMIMPSWLHNDFDRQHMLNIAVKMFGERT